MADEPPSIEKQLAALRKDVDALTAMVKRILEILGDKTVAK